MRYSLRCLDGNGRRAAQPWDHPSLAVGSAITQWGPHSKSRLLPIHFHMLLITIRRETASLLEDRSGRWESQVTAVDGPLRWAGLLVWNQCLGKNALQEPRSPGRFTSPTDSGIIWALLSSILKNLTLGIPPTLTATSSRTVCALPFGVRGRRVDDANLGNKHFLGNLQIVSESAGHMSQPQ